MFHAMFRIEARSRFYVQCNGNLLDINMCVKKEFQKIHEILKSMMHLVCVAKIYKYKEKSRKYQ